MYACDVCGKKTNEYLVNLYGVQMCEDCWDDYLFSPVGKVEVIAGIVLGEHSIDEFDADYLGQAAVQWNLNKKDFDISEETLAVYEKSAKELGLL